jgi:hypothetical protein
MPEAKPIRNTKVVLLAALCVTFAAACRGSDSTAPTADSTPAPVGVYHADIDQGALHSVDLDTRNSIGTAALRSCSLSPPGGCTVNGTVAIQQSDGKITISASYLNHTILATFSGAHYSDGTLRGTIVVTTDSHQDGPVDVTLRRTK